MASIGSSSPVSTYEPTEVNKVLEIISDIVEETKKENDIASTELKVRQEKIQARIDQLKTELDNQNSELASLHAENEHGSTILKNVELLRRLLRDNAKDDAKLYCRADDHVNCDIDTIRTLLKQDKPIYTLAFTEAELIDTILAPQSQKWSGFAFGLPPNTAPQ